MIQASVRKRKRPSLAGLMDKTTGPENLCVAEAAHPARVVLPPCHRSPVASRLRPRWHDDFGAGNGVVEHAPSRLGHIEMKDRDGSWPLGTHKVYQGPTTYRNLLNPSGGHSDFPISPGVQGGTHGEHPVDPGGEDCRAEHEWDRVREECVSRKMKRMDEAASAPGDKSRRQRGWENAEKVDESGCCTAE